MFSDIIPNLFDQYSLPENRVTHALIQALAGDKRENLRDFLKRFIKLQVGLSDINHVQVTTQKKPAGVHDKDKSEEDPTGRISVPDAWIVFERRGKESWAVVVENKIEKNKLDRTQIENHINNRTFRAYNKKYLLAITPDLEEPPFLSSLKKNVDQEARDIKIYWVQWTLIWSWAREKLESTDRDLRKTSNFLLHSLKRYIEMKENLTDFNGIEFSDGYNYKEAKPTVRKLQRALRKRVSKIYPELREERPAITDDGTLVWDVISQRDFRNDLHFTIGIHIDKCSISLTVPHKAGRRWTTLRKISKDPDELKQLKVCLTNVRNTAPNLWCCLHQRHFLFRKQPVLDAEIKLSLDTSDFISNEVDRNIKEVPGWFESFLMLAHECRKRQSNVEMQFSVNYNYERHEDKLKSEKFADEVAEIVKSFHSLYELLRG